MNAYILNEYLKKISKQDINTFAKKNDINLSIKELDIIYYYIKNRYQDIIKGNHLSILNELKEKISAVNYMKIESLYNKLKYKLS